MKKIFLYISFLFVATSTFAQVKVGSEGNIIATGNYPVAKSSDIKGGVHFFQTIVDRNNLPANFRDTGMIAYVNENNTYYVLIGGIANSNWQTWVERVLFFPTGCGVPDTLAIADSAINKYAIYGDSCNNKVYFYNPKTKTWSTIGATASDITGLISTGSNITITGTGTSADPYVINSTGGSGSTKYLIQGYGTKIDSSGANYTVAVDTTALKDSLYVGKGIANDTVTYPHHSFLILDSNYVRDSLLKIQGGTTGQALIKNSNADYDWSWKNVSSGGGGTHEVKQEYTGSSSVTITDSTTWLIINPAALASAITITMPASPTDKQLITISFGGTITGGNGVVSSLTVSPNTGQSIIQASAPSYVQSGESISYRYNISNTSYYRIN